jgi:fatty acid desaturase
MQKQHQNPSAVRLPARQLVPPHILQRIRKRSDIIGFALIIHAWGLIFAAMALFALWPNPLTFIIAVMVIGARHLGLAILTHDAAHNALFATSRFNTIISDVFCAWPQMSRTASYRRYHLQHHARTQQADDPDLILSAPFPITRKSLRRKLIRDLTGQTGLQQRKAQIISAWGPSELSLTAHLRRFADAQGPALASNLVILSICAVLFHWSYYFLFWVLPLLTYHMAITRLRNIAEHAVVPDNDDPFRNARTTKAGPLARLLLAPYWVNYHVEHHLLMHVPCYRLPLFHKALMAGGHGDKMEIADNYLDVLRAACSRPDDEDKPGNLVHNGRRRVSGNFTDGFNHPPAA